MEEKQPENLRIKRASRPATTRTSLQGSKINPKRLRASGKYLRQLGDWVMERWLALGSYRFHALSAAILMIIVIIVATDRLLWKVHLESWHYRTQMGMLITKGLSQINKDWSVEILKSKSVGYLTVEMPLINFKNQGKTVFTAKAEGALDLFPHVFFGMGQLTIYGKVDDGGEFRLLHQMSLRQIWRVLSEFTLPVPLKLQVAVGRISERVLWGLWPGLKSNPRLQLTGISLDGNGIYTELRGKFRLKLRPRLVEVKVPADGISVSLRPKPVALECARRRCEFVHGEVLVPRVGLITMKAGAFSWGRKTKGGDLMLSGQWTPSDNRAGGLFAAILGCDQPITSQDWSIEGSLSKPVCRTPQTRKN